MKGSSAPTATALPPHSASTSPFPRIAISSSRGGTTPDQENCPLPVPGAAVGCSDDCLCVPPSERPGNPALLPGNPAFLCEYSIGVLRSVKGQELLAPPLGQVEVRHSCHLTSLPSLCRGRFTYGRQEPIGSLGWQCFFWAGSHREIRQKAGHLSEPIGRLTS